MINNLRRIFYPTPEEQKEDFERYKKIHDELAKEKGMNTCSAFVFADYCSEAWANSLLTHCKSFTESYHEEWQIDFYISLMRNFYSESEINHLKSKYGKSISDILKALEEKLSSVATEIKVQLADEYQLVVGDNFQCILKYIILLIKLHKKLTFMF